MARLPNHFSDPQFRRIMRSLGSFQREVEQDATKYERGTLRRLHLELVDFGTKALRKMERDYTSSLGERLPPGFEETLRVLRDRFVGLWNQNLSKAFATAENSIEGQVDKRSRGKTILRRIMEFLIGAFQEDIALGLYVDENNRAYSTQRLVNKAAEETTARIKLTTLAWIWVAKVFTVREPNKPERIMSPRDYYAGLKKGLYKQDIHNNAERVRNADLSFPIVLNKLGHRSPATILDGVHRTVRALKLGRKTILAKVLTGGIPKDALLTVPPDRSSFQPNMSGIVRTRRVEVVQPDGLRVQQRQIYRIGLVSYVKLLIKTLPSNFIREADSLLLKSEALDNKISRGDRLFLISLGVSPESAQTCVLCQGRVLTADAFEFVQRKLSPNLFHPHCRHAVVRSFVATKATYNGRHGPILTLQDVRQWPSRERKIRLRRRNNPHYISA